MYCFYLQLQLSMISVARVEDYSLHEVEVENKTRPLILRRYLNCLEQEDPKLVEAIKEYYIR